ncbi:2-dehydro-3-deoxyphosphooctonate aldolase (KDO 8-P synthase) [Hephaestia caeni]|uniref:2-dehydro-3-deoxyphosphooctonate aldolase n=1 Tax=Hephaestia caeni TaxID=645617 RepID=A0A397PED8_9SPHN|nr:3-deoxy-8-phosphooctulonate synthase [Hephaestia caeni]RIA46289.1 2-dehydro-3-deoxyphosphooctonate aldolase (KDO 8-P synthase) [Hephaestia caeni]
MILREMPIGQDKPLFLIAGPCVLESAELALHIADRLVHIARAHNMLVIFKGSFDKANRTSASSYRGPGIDKGLEILARVTRETGLAVLTDVHEASQVRAVAEVVDVLQTPALLARQSDLIMAVASSGRFVNLKKGQFMAPWDMAHVLDKARSAAVEAGHDPDRFMLCERGVSFGYNNLVTDLRSLAIMAEAGAPVVFDATHSVQLPGGLGAQSGGERRHIPLLCRGAVAAGVAGLFLETHPDPDRALSDGPNSWPLDRLDALVAELIVLDARIKDSLVRYPAAD